MDDQKQTIFDHCDFEVVEEYSGTTKQMKEQTRAFIKSLVPYAVEYLQKDIARFGSHLKRFRDVCKEELEKSTLTFDEFVRSIIVSESENPTQKDSLFNTSDIGDGKSLESLGS